MRSKKLIISIFSILFLYTNLFNLNLFASNLIPNVSKEMEDPLFWIKKLKSPDRILLTENQIQKMNQENLKRQDLYLCDVLSLKDEWTKEEILSLFEEDLKGFGKTEEVRYGRNGKILNGLFWEKLINNMNRDVLRDKNQISFGFITARTDIRVFPTYEISVSNPDLYDFDRFQHSSISPGSPIAIYHFSRDHQWAYVQTGFIRGWVRRKDIAIAKSKDYVKNYVEEKNRLLITGDNIEVFEDPSFKRKAFEANMGCLFPIIKAPEGSDSKYIIKIPFNKPDGGLGFKKAYVIANKNVHQGFLPYTQENIAFQAFKLLNKKYSWGDKGGGIDCSRFIMDVFSSFGIIMPRNSRFQAQVGKPISEFDKDDIEKKRMILESAPPLATILRLPGHIMLYLGKDNEKYYVIHSIWGVQRTDKSGSTFIYKIGKVAITDLSLGGSGPDGSLLHRITDIRLIGEI